MHAKKLFILAFLCITIVTNGQKITRSDLKLLQNIEDTLTPYARKMIFGEDPLNRFEADSAFVKILVRALKIPNSFYYPFDSINTVSMLYPPDSSFRIFTWQLERDESYYRHHGALQMRTADGSLKIFPLIDVSEYTEDPVDSIRNNSNWIGAIYYGIVMKEFKSKKYYTLLGYDDYSFESTRKWLDMLTFDNNGNPQFGGRYFDYAEDSLKPAQPAYRFLLEYKKDARARMNYDPEMDMIIFDHLISETNESQKKFTLIPDGDYEGFKWQNGKWVHVDKVFTFKLNDGEAPVPAPLLDASGKADENKLTEQSKKNSQKEPSPKKPGRLKAIDDLQDYY